MEAPQAVLQWDRGALEAECERAATVQADVEAYLGRAVFTADGSLVVRVRLARVEDNGRVRVVARVTQETSDGRAWGEREVEGGASCESLDEPLTLVVALLVDAPTPPPTDPAPSEVAAPPAERPTPRAPAAPEPSDTGEIETAPGLEHATASPGHVALLAFGWLSMGILPSAAGGAGVLASIKPRGFWGLGLEAGGLLPQRLALGSGTLETSLLMLSGNVCPLQGVADGLWWSACGSLGAARLHARSRQVLEARTRSDWFAVPGVAVRGGRVMGRHLLLSAGLEALFPVSPDYYVYRSPEGEKQLAFEPSRLMITAQLGLGWLLE
jgi:hypothetical protein